MSAFREAPRTWARENAPAWALRSARRTRDRYRDRGPGAALRERVRALELEAQEARQLNRRVAELADVVTELLIPVGQRDPAGALELLEHYRSRL